MGEQRLVVLSETLRPKLRPGDDDHMKLTIVLNEKSRCRIRGEFPAVVNGEAKTFVQIIPIEGRFHGRVLSVCKDHLCPSEAGSMKGSSMETPEEVRQ